MGRSKALKSETIYITEKLHHKMGQLQSYPCTILEAPMGYGKTTAVRDYLRKGNYAVIWHRIIEGSLSEFWTMLCKQVAELDLPTAEALLKIGFPMDFNSREKALQVLLTINSKYKAKRKQNPENSKFTLLVLDDYHLIECDETNAFLEHVLFGHMSGFHIIITTRFTKYFKLEEMILKGYILHIKKEIFEFTPDDISSYYKKCGISVTPEESIALYGNTEGWVSALYLLLLGYKDEGRFMTTANIMRLIEKTIYMPFSDAVKDLLMVLSILDRFTLKQASHMWERGDAKVLLEQIIERNAFVSCDGVTKQYHVHHMFSEFLKTQFDLLSDDEKYDIYCRAGTWQMAQGDYFSAMRLFHKGKDFGLLLIALERDLGHSIHHDKIKEFNQFLMDCPIGERLNHPIALLITAITLFCLNEMTFFPQICDEYLESVQRPGVKDADELMGEFEILLSLTTFNDIHQMLAHVERANALMKKPVRFLDQKNSWTFGAPSVLYMFYRESGGLEQSVNSLKVAMSKYHNLVLNHGKGSELVMEAEYFYHQGDLYSAEIMGLKGLHIANQYNQQDIVLCASFLLARIDLWSGQYELAIQRIHKLYDAMDEQLLGSSLELCEAYLKSLVGISEGIADWILEGDYKNSHLNFPAKSFFDITTGRLMINSGFFTTFIGNSDSYMTTADVFPNLLSKVYLLIYEAIAYDGISRPNASKESLKQALELSIPDKLYLPFIENGIHLSPLLNELCHQAAYSEFVKEILKHSRSYNLALTKATKHLKKRMCQTTKLAGRELEIAKLAAEGLTNIEIGNRLYITQNTVKTQLKRIFQKLDIGSREQLKDYLI